ncbi:hypothetical protein [Commensalibacter papalotli (ex Botero et al. 2024)]|uniref:Uncharacterized protein n=1 Tax=Commensalibacter papalotli (ex Botero et al. 2024) TaxID=2972766 RepID=A0ABM9HRW5_9PROT|nr:hypothetical protein [Commensalibacter papalotli (ex Botero et al. 2024)]CAI3940782.1 unnamed protein product [Commensalibacter papalotli (ex Botero et al. 2024)]CAI3950239.1 unnamed protein product [Commensalibacter papalotli (ex Botero et al. 2024)]
MFRTKYKVSRAIEKKIKKLEKDFGMIFESPYVNFLKKFNVVECNEDFAFLLKENLIAGESDVSIDMFLGFSKDE